MSQYEELVAVSRAWVLRQDRAKDDLEKVIEHFVSYCGIPPDRVRYLRWDETRQVFTAKSDEVFSFSQACRVDNKTDEFSVCVCISLGHSGMGSHAKVTLVVRIKAVDELNSILTFGWLEPKTLNLQRSGWGNELFPAALETLKDSFDLSKPQPAREEAKKRIGFPISMSSDPQTTA